MNATKKACDLTADQLRACALKCPITLPKVNGLVAADSGDWFAYPAKTEFLKRYWRAAKKDLTDRRLGLKRQNDKYCGDFGRVEIGGKMFSFFPKSGMMVRDDFAQWCEANWMKVLTESGAERESTKPLRSDEVKVDELMHLWKEVRKRAMAMKEITLLMKPAEWNTMYDMKQTLSRYSIEIAADEKAGCCYAISKVQADLMASLIAYKERNYNDAVDFLLDMASAAIKTAQWVQKRHSKEEEGK